MKKLVLAASAAAMLAVPAAPAPAQEIPDINCGIVSCTEQIERKVEYATDCVTGTVHAIENAVAGYPQPYAC